MSAYACHRTSPTLRSTAGWRADGASMTTRYAGSAATAVAAGPTVAVSAASAPNAGNVAAASVTTWSHPRADRQRVAVEGTAAIIVDRGRMPGGVIVKFHERTFTAGGTERCGNIGDLAWAHRRKVGHVLARPVEVPVDARRIAEAPEADADASSPGAVMVHGTAGQNGERDDGGECDGTEQGVARDPVLQ